MFAREEVTRVVEVLQVVPCVIVPILAGDAVKLDGVSSNLLSFRRGSKVGQTLVVNVPGRGDVLRKGHLGGGSSRQASDQSFHH